MTDFAESTADGRIQGNSSTYSTSRSTSNSFSDTQTAFEVGRRYDGSTTYYTWRGFLVFDTSTIGAGATVTQANLKLVVTTDSSGVDFDIQIVKSDWSANNPMAAGTREAAFDAALTDALDDAILRNTSGISTNTVYTSGNLDPTWVSKTGNTYYALTSSADRNNDAAPTGTDAVFIAAQENATAGYRPVLSVVYTTADGTVVREATFHGVGRGIMSGVGRGIG